VIDSKHCGFSISSERSCKHAEKELIKEIKELDKKGRIYMLRRGPDSRVQVGIYPQRITSCWLEE
jgi:hypothetical protein